MTHTMDRFLSTAHYARARVIDTEVRRYVYADRTPNGWAYAVHVAPAGALAPLGCSTCHAVQGDRHRIACLPMGADRGYHLGPAEVAAAGPHRAGRTAVLQAQRPQRRPRRRSARNARRVLPDDAGHAAGDRAVPDGSGGRAAHRGAAMTTRYRMGVDATGRSVVGVTVPPRLMVDCPTCGAPKGTRCFRMSSVIDPEAKTAVYTERMDTTHEDRKGPSRAKVPISERGAMRKRISQLAQIRLTGTGRREVRSWATSSRRTDEELAAKVAELEAMPDLAW